MENKLENILENALEEKVLENEKQKTVISRVLSIEEQEILEALKIFNEQQRRDFLDHIEKLKREALMVKIDELGEHPLVTQSESESQNDGGFHHANFMKERAIRFSENLSALLQSDIKFDDTMMNKYVQYSFLEAVLDKLMIKIKILETQIENLQILSIK